MTAPDDFVARFGELFGVAYRASYPILGSREEPKTSPRRRSPASWAALARLGLAKSG